MLLIKMLANQLHIIAVVQQLLAIQVFDVNQTFLTRLDQLSNHTLVIRWPIPGPRCVGLTVGPKILKLG